MSILQNGIVPTSAAGYTIDNSLRLNDDDSAYLSWTPTSAGNRKTWTWSGWVKRGNLSEGDLFGHQGTVASNYQTYIRLESDYKLSFVIYNNASYISFLKTSALFRDVSAWYHLVVAVDTTQATSTNRVKFYINGEQLTDFSSTTYPSQNFDTYINSSSHAVGIGRNAGSTNGAYFDGYLAEVNFIDGQALDPSNFGETGDYGEWKPIKYTGTYGTNGFYLDFENSGSLGADVSGNGNNWTPTNLAAIDQMLDSPTNNFATWNPLAKEVNPPTFYEGNLKAAETAGTTWRTGYSWLMSSGKWYWEITPTATSGSYNLTKIGIVSESENIAAANAQNFTKALWYDMEGTKRQGTSATSYGSSYTAGDVIGVALDMDSNTITFYKNNVSQGELDLTTLNVGTDNVYLAFAVVGYYAVLNSGQDSSFAGNKTAQGNTDGNGYGDFYYTPPSGYLALCTQNLPDPAVIPSEHFAANLRTGTGSNTSVSGMPFAPDFVWIKARSFADWHQSFDILRGTLNRLHSNATSAESTEPNTLTAFNSDGYSLGGSGGTNGSGKTFVDWCWKANGSGVSNTDGTITSTVSANTSAGMSIVSYTGTGSAGTVGHGLSQAPELVIQKGRSYADNWHVGSTELSYTSGDFMRLNTTGAVAQSTNIWNSTAPTANVFSLGTDGGVNTSGSTNIAYCFHSVDGFSKVGSYTGNGSTDGTFVYTGFRPAYVMIKSSSNAEQWNLFDTTRSPYNVVNTYLAANDSSDETSTSNADFDITSNGFKLRCTHVNSNGSGATYIYIAFAENPFKHTNAR